MKQSLKSIFNFAESDSEMHNSTKEANSRYLQQQQQHLQQQQHKNNDNKL